ncbi:MULTISPECIES: hypothetical protein [Moraxella]|nr:MULTISPECIES: hypothetical protein [Moraxella]
MSKQIQFTKTGSPDVLQIVDVQMTYKSPPPKPMKYKSKSTPLV